MEWSSLDAYPPGGLFQEIALQYSYYYLNEGCFNCNSNLNIWDLHLFCEITTTEQQVFTVMAKSIIFNK